MEPTIDSGSIVYRSNFVIADADTALSVMSKCVSHGIPLVTRLIDGLARNPSADLPREPGDGQREYFGREVPNGGRLSWSSRARDVINFVRACDYYPFASPWGHPTTWLDQLEIGIVKSAATGERITADPGSVLSGSRGHPCIACADETVEVSHVILRNKFRLASEVLVPGQRLSDSRAQISSGTLAR